MKAYQPITALYFTLLLLVAACVRLSENNIPVKFDQAILSISGGGNAEKSIKAPSPQFAFDSNEETSWTHDNNTSGWIKIDFQTNHTQSITSLEFLPAHRSWSHAGIKNFAFEGSADDSTWEELLHGTAKDEFTFQKFHIIYDHKAYRFYRLRILDSYTSHIGISEIKLEGKFIQ